MGILRLDLGQYLSHVISDSGDKIVKGNMRGAPKNFVVEVRRSKLKLRKQLDYSFRQELQPVHNQNSPPDSSGLWGDAQLDIDAEISEGSQQNNSTDWSALLASAEKKEISSARTNPIFNEANRLWSDLISDQAPSELSNDELPNRDLSIEGRRVLPSLVDRSSGVYNSLNGLKIVEIKKRGRPRKLIDVGPTIYESSRPTRINKINEIHPLIKERLRIAASFILNSINEDADCRENPWKFKPRRNLARRR